MKFSIYPHIFQPVPSGEITLNDFVNDVKLGRYKDLSAKIAAEPDKAKRRKLKESKIPYVTVSGTFTHRKIEGLVQHTDLIAMDFDNLGTPEDANEVFGRVVADPYSFVVFRSISGTGLCIIVKIDGKRHLDSFLGLEHYYMAEYGLIADPQCKDVPRARFVSHDPNLFQNPKAKTFSKYLPKKAQKRPPEIIYSGNDIDHIFKQIAEKRVDLTHSSYERYLKIAFALQAEFGASGREYFHQAVCHSEKYDPARADKQFDYVLRSNKEGIKIGTFFQYAKDAGLSITTKKTQTGANLAKQAKKAGRDEESAKKSLEIAGVKGETADEIIERVFNSNIDLKAADDLSLISQLELFLSSSYRLRRNEVTRNIENGKQVLETKDFNSIYIHAKKVVDEKVNYMDLEKLINSDFTENYHPILSFCDTFRSRNSTGHIKALADCIKTDTGFATFGEQDAEYVEYFLKKWLVGMIALVHGFESPLLFALIGGQNTGKTQFFRRLLPDELKAYYAESKLDRGKDDEILMCQKLLIMDDELGGKSKQDEHKLKNLTSTNIFSLREPYGKKNIDMKRLAALGGTSNQTEILSDLTGNRRIIPVNVLSIDHEKYNAINKIDLFMEAYHLYMKGEDWNLNAGDIARLKKHTTEFEVTRLEFELITQHFRPSLPSDYIGKENMTATQMKIAIETESGQRILSMKRFGEELKAAGFEQKTVKVDGKAQRLYSVVRVSGLVIDKAVEGRISQDPESEPVIQNGLQKVTEQSEKGGSSVTKNSTKTGKDDLLEKF